MTKIPQPLAVGERGAVLVHVAVAMLALIAFSALAIDYGALMVSRNQAQNAADAAALAGALSLAFDDRDDVPRAQSAAKAAGEANQIWGAAPSIDLAKNDVRLITCPPGAPGLPDTCIRADVYRTARDARSNALPTFFAQIMGITSQEVRATATAQVASGNSVTGLLPFAVMDRWADNYDPMPETEYFPNDGLPGIAGWTPNDSFEPAMGDVYIPPYDGNTDHTGWTVTSDYGRQLILKDGSVGNYSAGWSQMVCLSGPANCSADDVGDWLTTPSSQAVGIATASNPCSVGDEPHGCIDVKTGNGVGKVRSGVENVVAQDSAVWTDPDGPLGPIKGAVTGGQGMASPRIRGMVVLDINHYDASGCTGSTCVGKVANIIGFFLEGICKDVPLDLGLACDQPNKDIVGRIVMLPAQSIAGTGGVEDSASFLRKVLLVR